MSKEINKIFEEWKQFLSWCYENNDKTTEIHRDNLERVMAYTRQLENIIKEVIEHLQETINRWEDYEQFYEVVVEDKYILGILDKEVS